MNSSIMYHIFVPLLATAIFLPATGNAKFGAILSLGRRAISRGASMARNGHEITGSISRARNLAQFHGLRSPPAAIADTVSKVGTSRVAYLASSPKHLIPRTPLSKLTKFLGASGPKTASAYAYPIVMATARQSQILSKYILLHSYTASKFANGNDTDTRLGSVTRGRNFVAELAATTITNAGGIGAFRTGNGVIGNDSYYKPLLFNGINYYWDKFHWDGRHGFVANLCSISTTLLMETEATDGLGISLGLDNTNQTENPYKLLSEVRYPNGELPKQIVWACETDEFCCGIDCCSLTLLSDYYTGNGAPTSMPQPWSFKQLSTVIISFLTALILYKY